MLPTMRVSHTPIRSLPLIRSWSTSGGGAIAIGAVAHGGMAGASAEARLSTRSWASMWSCRAWHSTRMACASA